MNQVKFYLYDENYDDCKGKDLSSYVAIGTGIKTSLDGTIDTYAITLNGLPFSEEITPTTKFICEVYSDNELQATIDMVLQDDVVEKPILSDDTYFIHKLSLANAAVIAQQKMCDNMAFTYRLKDVDLSSNITIDTSANISVKATQIENTYSLINTTTAISFDEFVHQKIETYNALGNKLFYTQDYILYNFIWRQPTFSYDYSNKKYYRSGVVSIDSSGNGLDLKKLKTNYVLEDKDTTTIEFTAPDLMCNRGVYGSNNIFGVGQIPICVVVKRTSKTKVIEYYNNKTKTWSTTYTENISSPNGALGENLPTSVYDHLSLGEWSKGNYNEVSGIYALGNLAVPSCSNYVVTSTDAIYTELATISTGDIDETLSAPTTEDEMILANKFIKFEADVNHQYSIECYPNFSKTKPFTYAFRNIYCIGQTMSVGMTAGYPKTEFRSGLMKSMVNISSNEISIYSKSTATKAIVKSSSTVPTCYDMLKKAVLTTYSALRETNVEALETSTYITLDSSVENKLRTTAIVESVLQDKNLWEVILEIGNYVHAKPYLTFDRDTKKGSLRLQFKEYGSTEINTNKGTQESVFNSKFLEEYVSSLECYANNLMQLGATITETTFLQSESDDYLVYNDTACLLTKYPISEIVKLEIMDSSDNGVVWNDITDYVYEYNIWKCLGLKDTELPYRGNSLYYHLYSNKIEGFQYLVPSVNSTTQYPLKLIVHDIYGTSTSENITFSDYSFRITYRTKTDLRVRTTRPDLRKYIANSDYEFTPIHTQVSNQTAKTIDSEALGTKLYGELIRTGNSIYEKNIWSDSLEDINKVGDLVKLEDDNLYYISRIESQIYSDHIESNIEYTKDFNRLSQIIGIPSEPRFYEISEQDNIVRDVNIEQPILFFTNGNQDVMPCGGWDIINVNMETTLGPSPIKQLLVGEYSYRFDMVQIKLIDNQASFIDTANDSYKNNLYIYNDLMWSVQNTTLTFTTKMEDNFMVANGLGDTSDTQAYAPNMFTIWDYLVNGKSSVNTQSYKTLEPVRYVDLYGKVEYAMFTLGHAGFENNSSSPKTSKEMSKVIRNKYSNDNSFTSNNGYARTNTIVLNKDNRETLRFNFNFHCITDSDRICISDQVWKMRDYMEDEKLQLVVFYDSEINKQSRYIFSNDYDIGEFTIDELLVFERMSKSPYSYLMSQYVLYLNIPLMIKSTQLETKEIKSVALCKQIGDRFVYFIGKNLTGLTTAEKANSIYIDVGKFANVKNETQLNKLLK